MLILSPHLHSTLTLPQKNRSSGAEQEIPSYVCGEAHTTYLLTYSILLAGAFLCGKGESAAQVRQAVEWYNRPLFFAILVLTDFHYHARHSLSFSPKQNFSYHVLLLLLHFADLIPTHDVISQILWFFWSCNLLILETFQVIVLSQRYCCRKDDDKVIKLLTCLHWYCVIGLK